MGNTDVETSWMASKHRCFNRRMYSRWYVLPSLVCPSALPVNVDLRGLNFHYFIINLLFF